MSSKTRMDKNQQVSSKGMRRAMNFIQDLTTSRGQRKQVVCFYYDADAGAVRESGTGKLLDMEDKR